MSIMRDALDRSVQPAEAAAQSVDDRKAALPDPLAESSGMAPLRDRRDMDEQGGTGQRRARRSFWIDHLPQRKVGFLRSQAIALACIAVAGGLRLALDPFLVGAPFITFFPAVVVASAFGGRRAGISALLLSIGVTGFAGIWRPTGNFSASIVSIGLFLLSAGLMVAIIDALQRLARELRLSQERADILAREMRHRVGNVMQLVQAIAQMTGRSARSAEDFLPLFTGRMQALAEAHRLSSGAGHAPPALHALIKPILAAFDRQRIEVQGPPVGLCDPVAANLALVLHELATNATKYGALCVAEGRVRLDWRVDGKTVVVSWTERGGPKVETPTRTGFGTRLIQAALMQADAEADLAFNTDGLQCIIRLKRWHSI